MNIQNAIASANARWPHLQFKRVGAGEWAGPCPWCGGTDRFHIWERGNYLCRPGSGHCGAKGWIDEGEPRRKLTPEEVANLRMAEMERKQRELEARLGALERMHQCTDHIRYHKALDDSVMAYWQGEGITPESVQRYTLGYCYSCPVYPKSPSYTIPIINRGKLENIRHRLVNPERPGDKYRPHIAGLGASLFNLDLLDAVDDGHIVVTEGEKKSIVVAQAGIANVGICGQRSFNSAWLPYFAHVQSVTVVLDPGAEESAHRLAAMFGERGRVATVPVKIDDAIAHYGATPDDVRHFLGWARRVA